MSNDELQALVHVSRELINRFQSPWFVLKSKEQIINEGLGTIPKKRSGNFNKMLQILKHKMITKRIRTRDELMKRINKMLKFKNERHQFVANLFLSQLVAQRFNETNNEWLATEYTATIACTWKIP